MRTFGKNEDWFAAVRQLPMDLAGIDQDGVQGGMREALVAIWLVAAHAPSALRQDFNNLADSEIALLPDTLDERSFGLELPTGDQPKPIMLALARALRFIDDSLGDYAHMGTVSPAEEWLVVWAGDEYYVVPRARTQWLVGALSANGSGAFARRALRYRRIVPKHHDGAEVHFTMGGVLPGQLSRYGAVFFEGMSMELDKSEPGTFIVTSVNATSLVDTAISGIRTARAQDVALVVYPELMIDLDVRSKIQKELRKPVKSNSIGLVLAGSWHLLEGDIYRNAAVLFDGFGKEVLTYRKRMKFTSKDGLEERIVPGDYFEVLVTDQGLVSFATCLDFAQRYEDTPFGALDLELVMVPSCGNTSTMEGHLRTASDMYTRRKTRSFVVQQADEDTAKALSISGFYLFPDQEPSKVIGWAPTATTTRWEQSPRA